jgi:hypothetical protein
MRSHHFHQNQGAWTVQPNLILSNVSEFFHAPCVVESLRMNLDVLDPILTLREDRFSVGES